jgi:hypothetical protein
MTIVSYRRMNAAITPNLEMSDEGLESAQAPEFRDAAKLADIAEALQLLEQAERDPTVMSATEQRLASQLQTFLAMRAAEAGQVEETDGGILEAKFDNQDLLGWIGSFFTWVKRIRPHKWIEAAAEPSPIANRFSAALMGDWGTGLYGAPVVSRSIENGHHKPELIVHLGDVYYSGTDDEIRERMLDVWPKVPGAISRAVNGNHEMYTGGKAFFKLALKDFGQPASYFAFMNDHWVLAGLDTAYKDHDLHGNQVAWLNGILENAGDRRLILFSHHQLFALLDKQGPNLARKLQHLLDSRRIFAWYWGHNHYCLLYDQHPAWGLLGRCLGHGGYPYFREESFGAPPAEPEWRALPSKNLVPGGRILDGSNPFVVNHEKTYGPHGYVTLEFDGPHLNEVVHLADDSKTWSQELA